MWAVRRHILPRFRVRNSRSGRWKKLQYAFAKGTKSLLVGFFDHFDRQLQLRVFKIEQFLLFV